MMKAEDSGTAWERILWCRAWLLPEPEGDLLQSTPQPAYISIGRGRG